MLEGDVGVLYMAIILARYLTKGYTMNRSWKNPTKAINESPTNLLRKTA